MFNDIHNVTLLIKEGAPKEVYQALLRSTLKWYSMWFVLLVVNMPVLLSLIHI